MTLRLLQFGGVRKYDNKFFLIYRNILSCQFSAYLSPEFCFINLIRSWKKRCVKLAPHQINWVGILGTNINRRWFKIFTGCNKNYVILFKVYIRGKMKDILFNEHVSGNESSPKCRWKRVKIHSLYWTCTFFWEGRRDSTMFRSGDMGPSIWVGESWGCISGHIIMFIKQLIWA